MVRAVGVLCAHICADVVVTFAYSTTMSNAVHVCVGVGIGI